MKIGGKAILWSGWLEELEFGQPFHKIYFSHTKLLI